MSLNHRRLTKLRARRDGEGGELSEHGSALLRPPTRRWVDD